MTETTAEIYQLWEFQLNAIWARLKDTLNSETINTLTVQEREWIAYKEAEVQIASSEFEGGTLEPMVKYSKNAELTRLRVYELAEHLR